MITNKFNKMSTFEQDLLEGQAIENKLATILEDRGNKVIMNDAGVKEGCRPTKEQYEQLKKYDMTVTTKSGKVRTIEVKNDKMSAKTGNICIERATLKHTEATLYAYHFDGKFYIIHTRMLKDMINSKEYFKAVRGGDQNHILYLFKIDTIKNMKNILIVK